MADEANDMLQSFNLTEVNRKKCGPVKAKFEGRFLIKRNVIFERAKFNMNVQKEGEPVDNFITDLYSLTEHCNFGTLHDELIRDRIVVGIGDKALSENSKQLEAELTLEGAINQVRQKEAVRKRQIVLRAEGDSPSQTDVDYVKMKGKQKFTQKVNPGKEQFKQVKSRPAVTTKQKCERCNGPPHARDWLCNNCGRKGHLEESMLAKLLAK